MGSHLQSSVFQICVGCTEHYCVVGRGMVVIMRECGLKGYGRHHVWMWFEGVWQSSCVGSCVSNVL